jgi:hypothetical protein
VTSGRSSRFGRLERLRLQAWTALFVALKSAVEKGLSTAGLMLLCSSGNARLRAKRFEMTRKIEIERFSLTTAKQFDEVIAGVNAAIGYPDMAEFGRSTHEARSFAELKSAVERGLSKAGLMLFPVTRWLGSGCLGHATGRSVLGLFPRKRVAGFPEKQLSVL